VPISHTHKHTCTETRDARHAHRHSKRIEFFTAPMYSGGGGRYGTSMCVCLCISFGADRTEIQKSWDTAVVVVLPRATQSTQWAQSILEKSSQLMGELDVWANRVFHHQKNMWKQRCREPDSPVEWVGAESEGESWKTLYLALPESYVCHPIQNSEPTESISSTTAVGTSWLPTFRL